MTMRSTLLDDLSRVAAAYGALALSTARLVLRPPPGLRDAPLRARLAVARDAWRDAGRFTVTITVILDDAP